MGKTIWPLTEKEQQILRYLEGYLRERGTSPTYREVQEHFGFKSIHSVQKYFHQLEQKGYLRSGPRHRKRSLVVTQSADAFQNQYRNSVPTATTSTPALELPLLGRAAAGLPLERHIHNETMEVPRSLVRRPESSFILQVEGDSMVEDGIFHEDFLIVQQQSLASNGEIVVAVVEDEATVKRFYLHDPKTLERQSRDPSKSIELRPSNSTMSSFWYAPEQVEIRGVIVGLIRRF
jgi:repressor LexA